MIIVVVDDESIDHQVIWRGSESQVRRIHSLVIRRLATKVMTTGQVQSSGVYRAWQEPPIEDPVNGKYSRR